MDTNPYMPRKTADSLSEPPVKGTRHETMKAEILSMLGNGWPPVVVFATARAKYPPDVSDKEIQGIVDWGESLQLQPSTPRIQGFRPSIKQPAIKSRSPQEHAEWWLTGRTMTQEEFRALSKLPIPERPRDALCLALEMLWLGSDNLNVVGVYTEEGGKAKPQGPGRILSRDKWLEYVRGEKGVPKSKAGVWIRPNPCKAQGSGAAGAVTDSDITAWRYLLLESDVLPLNQQLSLFARLKLPIAAVIMSGGISAHAWVRLDAPDEKTFSDIAKTLLALLAPFGIDQANKNPSRLSRLPCATRIIGASEDGLQRLLWLNPAAPPLTAKDLAAFGDSLDVPALEEKPFKRIVHESLNRYDELCRNQGKLGVPTGIVAFDRDTGGLMAGQMTVLAGETNSGKSTTCVNIINGATTSGHGVALFTLEMGREEIADMIFSINCRVDRNHFNTGAFTEGERQSMIANVKRLSELPLWVFDESTLSATQIRKRILTLKAEAKISLAVVDYAQIVMPEIGDNREQQVANVARTLCATAKDAKIALVVLSQLNDEGRIRESRVISHEAHNVVVLENKEQESQMIFKVVKGRRIQKKDYMLYYDAIHCRLASIAYTETESSNQPHADP